VLKAVAVEPIATKDIALAVMSGSASIASILLVFIGFVIARAEALPSETDDAIVKKHTLPAKIGLIPLLEQVVVLGASYLWLYYPTSNPLFVTWSFGFALGLVLFIGYSAYITLRL
jgi:hypothetical protein